jgi:THO complex subunit 5
VLLSLQYYDKEISSKRTFQPSVPDDKLCCISSQDFLQQQQDVQQPQSDHELELGRLNYELGQRKQLKAHLQKLLQQKQRAQLELSSARERIDELRGHMEAIKSSSKSLLETSLPESAAVSRNREAAELLPLPLYIIYSQAATASSVLGLPVSADIAGSTAAAERLAATEADAAAAAAAPAAADAVQAAKRRRKSEAQEDQAYKVGSKALTAGAVFVHYQQTSAL